MRVSTALMTAGAAVVLSACSGAPQGGTAGLPSPAAHRLQLPGGRVLYVPDVATNAVEVLKYGTWTSVGTITSGITFPNNSWVDTNGNFYVTNRFTASGTVTEYDAGGNLIFTYSTSAQPSAVTTDKNGNVYVAEATAISEYAQGSNVAAVTCSLPSVYYTAHGIAVNRRGTVFISYTDSRTASGGIIAYPFGLTAYGCDGGVLPITIGGPLGIAFDRQGNLLVCDSEENAPAVDIVAPPYHSITGTLGSGWVHPNSVTIDRAGTTAYIAERGSANDVRVLTYPGGVNEATLGSANGISEPVSAVDSKNYVP